MQRVAGDCGLLVLTCSLTDRKGPQQWRGSVERAEAVAFSNRPKIRAGVFGGGVYGTEEGRGKCTLKKKTRQKIQKSQAPPAPLSIEKAFFGDQQKLSQKNNANFNT